VVAVVVESVVVVEFVVVVVVVIVACLMFVSVVVEIGHHKTAKQGATARATTHPAVIPKKSWPTQLIQD